MSVLEQAQKAIYQLYSSSSGTDVISNAERWLLQLQQSPEAWSVSWQLLEKDGVEVQNFGALLLQNKLMRSWTDLSPDQYESLRQQLFQVILKFSNGPKLVLTRLCVAMVIYMFNAIPDVWPNAVVSLIQSLSTSSSIIVLVTILQILPEEFEGTADNVFSKKRMLLREALANSSTTVFSFCERLLASEQPIAIKEVAIKCVASWASFQPALPELLSLCRLLLDHLGNRDLLPCVCEALTKIITNSNNGKYPIAQKQLHLVIIQLGDFMRGQINEEDRDMEICNSLCELLTSSLDSNMDMYINGVTAETTDNCEEVLEALQLLVSFTSISGQYPVAEQCSVITFTFWMDLLDRIASADSEHSQYLVDFYNGILSCLIEIFPIKARYPLDEDWCTWDEDERDEFVKYREEMCDLAESLQRTLHTEYLQHLTMTLDRLLTAESSLWQDVEAVLFLLQGVTSNITNDTAHILCNIVSVLPHLPLQHTVLRTVLRLLGDMSTLLQAQPTMLQSVLPIILNGLTTPTLTSSAALAFRDISSDCNESLAPLMGDILPACQVALASDGAITLHQVSLIVASIGTVLSCLPVASVMQHLDILVSPHIEKLEHLSQQQPSSDIHSQILKQLTILSSLCVHVYPSVKEEQHPVISLLVKVWAILQSLLDKWILDSTIVDVICTSVSRAIRTTKIHYLPLMQHTIALIIKGFGVSQYYSFLDIATELVTVFGATCQQYLMPFLQGLVGVCIQVCQNGLRSVDPDFVQSFITLLAQIWERHPILFVNIEGMVANSYDIGVGALQLPEQPSVKLANCLLLTLIGHMNTIEQVKEVILARGRNLLELLLRGIAGTISRSQLHVVTDIIALMLANCITELSKWMEELLSQDDFPVSKVSHADKQNFRNTVLRLKGNPKKLHEKINEFSINCRGFQGTLYGAQTSRTF